MPLGAWSTMHVSNIKRFRYVPPTKPLGRVHKSLSREWTEFRDATFVDHDANSIG